MTSSSETTSSKSAANRAADLRNDVVHRWNLAGRPTPEQLAAATGKDSALFRDFLDGRCGFNPHLQLRAMNEALPASDEHARRFRAAVRQWMESVTGPPTERSLKPVRVKPKTRVAANRLTAEDPLLIAKRADSVTQFNHQLRRLMIKTNTSFADIGRKSENLPRSTAHHMVSHDRLTAREDQIRAFVIACGASDEEQEEWVAAWREARKRFSPAATPAVAHERAIARQSMGPCWSGRHRVLCKVTIESSQRARVFRVTGAGLVLIAMALTLLMGLSLWGARVLRASEAAGISPSAVVALVGTGLSVMVSVFTGWRSRRYVERYRRGEKVLT
jgi:hypothetical protein